MRIKIFENKGKLNNTTEDVLVVSFNDMHFIEMCKSFYERFSCGEITLFVNGKNEIRFQDKEGNILEKVDGIYR